MPNTAINRRLRSSRMGGCNLATNAKTTAWKARLSGTPSQRTIDAANCFANTVDASAVVAWSDIIALNFFPEQLTDVGRYPYILGPGSRDPWNIGGSFINADLTVNGLKGDGSAKSILTGIDGSNFSSVNSAGIMIYQTEIDTATNGVLAGGLTGGGANTFLLTNRNGGTSAFDAFDQVASQISVASPGIGFLSAQRTASNAINIYFAKAGTPHAAIATGANATTGTTAVGELVAFALNAGGPLLFSNARISVIAITNGISSTKSAMWFYLFDKLRRNLGGGFV